MENLYDELLGKEINCSCGKTHKVPIKKILISKNALEKVYDILKELGYSDKFHIVADLNTYKIAGKTITDDFDKRQVKYEMTLFTDEELIAGGKEIDRIISEIKDDVSCVIAVGSGTVNDLSRYSAFKKGKPYIVVATAPSMDGYSSPSSPLVFDGFKNSYHAIVPLAIIGDLDILKNAPSRMIEAGIGDMIGKYTSLADWKMSHCLTGEYYCEYIETFLRKMLESCLSDIEGIKKREENAIKNLTDVLVLSGIGMIMAGNSRPASGAEHMIAHFWEMKLMQNGKKQPLHGQKVGVTTVIIADIYCRISKFQKKDISGFLEGAKILTKEETVRRIKNSYGKIADLVIAENFNEEASRFEPAAIMANWEDIKKIAGEVPASDKIRSILKQLGAVSEPSELGIDEDLKKESILSSMYIKKRLTVLRLFDVLGLLK
jgi:glycerol-1-phosphate dehydrogenase [NAD(P)+]